MMVRAVIGPGLMGHGIALVLAKRPGAVWLYGTRTRSWQRGWSASRRVWSNCGDMG